MSGARTEAGLERPVLIVDDDPDLCASLAMLLGTRGIRAASVRDGTSALDYLRGQPRPRLIVLDLHMPVMGGRELLTRLRHEPGLTGIPVLIYSVAADAADCADLPGVVAVCAKSADPQHLLELIERHAGASG